MGARVVEDMAVRTSVLLRHQDVGQTWEVTDSLVRVNHEFLRRSYKYDGMNKWGTVGILANGELHRDSQSLEHTTIVQIVSA